MDPVTAPPCAVPAPRTFLSRSWNQPRRESVGPVLPCTLASFFARLPNHTNNPYISGMPASAARCVQSSLWVNHHVGRPVMMLPIAAHRTKAAPRGPAIPVRTTIAPTNQGSNDQNTFHRLGSAALAWASCAGVGKAS